MIENFFLLFLGLVWIIFAVVQDIREREVANWLNFSLIIFALGFRFFYSLFNFESGGFNFFYQGLIGLGIFFVLGNVLYYGKMFAGGDAKLMIALGAVLPLFNDFSSNLKVFITFFILFLLSGAIYSLVSSFVLGIKNFRNFRKEFSKQFGKNKKMIFLGLLFSICFLIFSFFESSFFFLSIIVFVMPYLYLYVKSVDESCMVKKISSDKLREGDWLYKDVGFGKRKILAKWRGLNKKEISLIRKNKDYVLIREGIPFTPAFLIAFLLLYFFLKIGLWNPFW